MQGPIPLLPDPPHRSKVKGATPDANGGVAGKRSVRFSYVSGEEDSREAARRIREERVAGPAPAGLPLPDLPIAFLKTFGVGAAPGVESWPGGKVRAANARPMRLCTWPATEYHTERWACDTRRR